MLMSRDIGLTDENNAYEVVLGSYGNKHVSLRRGSLTTDKVNYEAVCSVDNTENLLFASKSRTRVK